MYSEADFFYSASQRLRCVHLDLEKRKRQYYSRTSGYLWCVRPTAPNAVSNSPHKRGQHYFRRMLHWNELRSMVKPWKHGFRTFLKVFRFLTPAQHFLHILHFHVVLCLNITNIHVKVRARHTDHPQNTFLNLMLQDTRIKMCIILI